MFMPEVMEKQLLPQVVMDNQLIFDLWNEIISASRLLGVDTDFASHLKQRLNEMAQCKLAVGDNYRNG